MREELTRAGIKEARTAAEVDSALARPGTTLLVVNSICGCAAGKMRPAVRLGPAAHNHARPGRHRLRRAGRRGHPARSRLPGRQSAQLARRRHLARRPARLPDAALGHRNLHRARHRPGALSRLRRLLRHRSRVVSGTGTPPNQPKARLRWPIDRRWKNCARLEISNRGPASACTRFSLSFSSSPLI